MRIDRVFAALLVLALGACGGGGSAPPPPPPHVPGISSLTYTTPMTAVVNSGGGAVTARWTFDFIDNGKDITTMIWEALDGAGAIARTVTVPIPTATGIQAGTVGAFATFPTTTVGVYQWRCRVVDAAGNSSNNLNGTWTVTATSLVDPDPPKAPPMDPINIEAAVVTK